MRWVEDQRYNTCYLEGYPLEGPRLRIPNILNGVRSPHPLFTGELDSITRRSNKRYAYIWLNVR